MASKNVKPVPEGYNTITPYLVVKNAGEVIEFLKKAFNAQETFRMEAQDGTIRHAELKIKDSNLMLSEATAEHGPTSTLLHLYVEDVDTIYHQALLAGAKSVKEPADQFYGDRSAGVKDPSGTNWWISTHIEDVPMEELKKREAEMEKAKQ